MYPNSEIIRGKGCVHGKYNHKRDFERYNIISLKILKQKYSKNNKKIAAVNWVAIT